jgi:outer membrane receptor for Fe3+-dicitrate
MPTKIVSASAQGRYRKTTAVRQSTDSRIQQLLRELGMDVREYKVKASFRMYERMSTHKYLGIS